MGPVAAAAAAVGEQAARGDRGLPPLRRRRPRLRGRRQVEGRLHQLPDAISHRFVAPLHHVHGLAKHMTLILCTCKPNSAISKQNLAGSGTSKYKLMKPSVTLY